jgi:hypothetical protein
LIVRGSEVHHLMAKKLNKTYIKYCSGKIKELKLWTIDTPRIRRVHVGHVSVLNINRTPTLMVTLNYIIFFILLSVSTCQYRVCIRALFDQMSKMEVPVRITSLTYTNRVVNTWGDLLVNKNDQLKTGWSQ